MTKPTTVTRIVVLLGLAGRAAGQGRPPDFFTTPLSVDQMKGKQAVVETSLGTIVIQLLPDASSASRRRRPMTPEKQRIGS